MDIRRSRLINVDFAQKGEFGDGFQALLRRPEAVRQVIVILESALVEIPVRYGLGWGGLSTDLRPKAIGMDGPCFHAAWEGLVEGKHRGSVSPGSPPSSAGNLRCSNVGSHCSGPVDAARGPSGEA